MFWEEAEKYINEDEAAVDDRKHAIVTHLAKQFPFEIFENELEPEYPMVRLFQVLSG